MLKFFLALTVFSMALRSAHLERACPDCKLCARHEIKQETKKTDAFMMADKSRPMYLALAPSLNGIGHAFFAHDEYFYKDTDLSGIYEKFTRNYFPHWIRSIALPDFEIIWNNEKIRIKSGNKFLAVKPVSKDSWQWALFISEEVLKENDQFISEFELLINAENSFAIKIPRTKAWLAVKTLNNDNPYGAHNAFFADLSYLESENTDYFGSSTWNYTYFFKFRNELHDELKAKFRKK